MKELEKKAKEIFQGKLEEELPEGFYHQVFDGHFPGDEIHVLVSPSGKTLDEFFIDF